MQQISGAQLTPITVTLATAQFMTGLSRATLLRRADEGELDTVKVHGRRLIVVSSLKRLLGLDQQKTTEVG
jgi:hypothetical protein